MGGGGHRWGALVAAAAAALLTWLTWPTLRDSFASLTWVPVEARLIDAGAHGEHPGFYQDQKGAEYTEWFSLAYGYTYQGQHYRGTRFDVATDSKSQGPLTQQIAIDITARGLSPTVFVDPRDPTRAVVAPGPAYGDPRLFFLVCLFGAALRLAIPVRTVSAKPSKDGAPPPNPAAAAVALATLWVFGFVMVGQAGLWCLGVTWAHLAGQLPPWYVPLGFYVLWLLALVVPRLVELRAVAAVGLAHLLAAPILFATALYFTFTPVEQNYHDSVDFEDDDVIESLTHPNPHVVEAMGWALHRDPRDAAVLPGLERCIEHPVRDARRACIAATAEVGAPAAYLLPIMERLLDEAPEGGDKYDGWYRRTLRMSISELRGAAIRAERAGLTPSAENRGTPPR